MSVTYTRNNNNPDWGKDTITMVQSDTEVSERSHVDGIDGTDFASFSSDSEAAEYIRNRGIDLVADGYTKQ